jgi:beta-lactamase regulating signal transducer with metallopeptidase domain
LPPSWQHWHAAKLAAVLAHEGSHIRRRDPAIQFLSAIHRALLWASPASWLLDRAIVRCAEQISDDDAIAATLDRVSYPEMLLDFVQQAGDPRHALVVPMARYDRPEKRIRRILRSTGSPGRLSPARIVAILLAAAPLAYFAAAGAPAS